MTGDVAADKPKQKPVWLRVLVQIGLALVLSFVTPLLGVPLSPLLSPLLLAAKHAGAGKPVAFAIIQVNGALPFLLTGALAALLTWWIVRKAWDVLGYCALHGAFILAFGIMCCPREPQQQPWWWPTMVASEILAGFAGAAIVALIVQRRRTPVETRPVDASAFLP